MAETASKPRKPKPAPEQAPAEPKLPHISAIYQSQWIDDAGNIYYLDEPRRGEYTLRLWKRAPVGG